MKKTLAFLLALPLVFALAACSNSDNGNGADAAYDNAEAIMTATWDGIEEKFPIMGGDPANAVMDAPAAHSLSDTDSLTVNFHIPADLVANVDDAASLMHAMNANTLTAIAVHLTDGADVDAAIDAIKDDLESTQWMCGFPDKYIIAKVPGNYLVVAYGVHSAIDPFQTSLADNVTGLEIVVDKALA